MSDISKLPPQVVDLEESVLGALMLEKYAIMEVAEILTEESFYHEKHSIIYNSNGKIFKYSLPIMRCTAI